MIFRKFRTNCIIRLTLITATICVFFYLVFRTDIYATMVITGLVVIGQMYLLLRYVESVTRGFTRFLSSIRYSDFTTSFKGKVRGAEHEELFQAFDKVLSEFQKGRADKEEQFRYLQALVEHVGLGIISFDQDGHIDLINRSAKKLLKVSRLTNIQNLKTISDSLVRTLCELDSGERGLAKINIEGENLTLAIVATIINLRSRSITLVSLQNIESELAEQEMISWQKLIRVLNHEIMNSVTPLASLAGTARGLIDKAKTDEFDESAIADISSAVTVIENRSHALLKFIESYRNLTRIPDPDIKIFAVRPLLERIKQLLDKKITDNSIRIKIKVLPDNMKLMADPELIEQVVINIVLNAIQAVKDNKDARIDITAWIDENDHKRIAISDNGIGISEEMQEKIFTPFFTTRKEGTGIGLSLSLQILRKHGGSINVKSEPDQYTTFTLRF